MKMSDFISGIISSLTRNDVATDGALTVHRLQKYTLPAYKQAATILKKDNEQSKVMKTINIDIKTAMRAGLASKRVVWENGAVIPNIARGIPVIAENLEKVCEEIEKSWNEKIDPMGFNYKDANLLQFVSLCEFVERYSRGYLNLAYIEECGIMDPEANGFASIPKAEKDWLVKNATAFAQSFSVVAVKPEKLMAALSVIPDIAVAAQDENAVAATVGRDKIDPLQMSFIPASWNPIYHIRMRVVDLQKRWNDEAKMDLQRLELRVLYLEELKKKGGANIRVQTELERTNDRVNDLKYKIAEYEKGN
jgi:hypothetical protein